MGEYEDRYPDAYGRDGAPVQQPKPEDLKGAPPPGGDRLGAGAAAGATAPPAWQHAPAEPVQTVEPTTAPPPGSAGRDYRGVGPRSYVRAPTRIYEDICDRLTEHPLIDASDIEVLVSGIEVVLAGSVDNAIAGGRAEAIARAVPGVKAVRNTLTVRQSVGAVGGER